MRVVLYGKPGCHLCDVAESRLRAMAGRVPLRIEKVDILSDPALEARFGTTIPAVEVDGVVVSEGRFDEKAVARAVGA
jgi:hypothetical protein